jgi:hypothetical protein
MKFSAALSGEKTRKSNPILKYNKKGKNFTANSADADSGYAAT